MVLLKADVKPGMSDFDRSNDMHMIGRSAVPPKPTKDDHQNSTLFRQAPSRIRKPMQARGRVLRSCFQEARFPTQARCSRTLLPCHYPLADE